MAQASILDEPAITQALAALEKRFDKARLLLQVVKSLDPDAFGRHAASFSAKDPALNKFQFVTDVEALYKDSTLFANNSLTSGYFNPADNRLTAEADAKMRQLSQQYSWYLPRENTLRAIAGYMASVNTNEKIMKRGPAIIDEFTKSITSNHSIQPFEAVVFILIMRSFTTVNNVPSFHPQLLLWLCEHILARTPGPSFFLALNWITILPDEELVALLGGTQPPINPDVRITEIGDSILRIRDFPLMPDVWGLKAWNSHQLNLANSAVVPMSGHASATSATGPTNKPLEPFAIFRSTTAAASSRERGSSSQVQGLDELNTAISSIAAGGNAKVFRLSLSSDGTLDLKPLAKFLTNLLPTKDTTEKASKGKTAF